MIFFVNDGVKNQQVGLFREKKNFFKTFFTEQPIFKQTFDKLFY